MSVLPLNLIKGTRSVAYELLENTDEIEDVEQQIEKLKAKVFVFLLFFCCENHIKHITRVNALGVAYYRDTSTTATNSSGGMLDVWLKTGASTTSTRAAQHISFMIVIQRRDAQHYFGVKAESKKHD